MTRALMLGILLLAGSTAAAIVPAAFPHLMEFRDALADYQRGEHVVARAAFRHLSELGDPEARFNLAVMLLKGEGGVEDEVEALAWMRWAAEAGNETARLALPTVEAALAEDAHRGADELLAALRAEHDALEMLQKEPRQYADSGCLLESMRRASPHYPARSAQERQIGYAVLHFLVSPEGNVDAVHAMPTLIRDDRFAEPARRAVRRWHAHDCPSNRYRHYTQIITFDLHGRTDFSESAHRWAQETLDRARTGDAAHAYLVAEVDAYMDGLFPLEAGERGRLMLRAAIAGIAEARHALAGWLQPISPAHAERWRVLAAGQGFAPALLAVSMRNDLPAAARRDALVRAARDGFLPAVLLAVRELASHPLEEERDGVLALTLTSALPERLLRDDPSLAEAHAAALAENGRMQEAVEWQQRALRVARRLKRERTQSELRLAAYRNGQPWRDVSLVAASVQVKTPDPDR
jgi:hypothetical protein